MSEKKILIVVLCGLFLFAGCGKTKRVASKKNVKVTAFEFDVADRPLEHEVDLVPGEAEPLDMADPAEHIQDSVAEEIGALEQQREIELFRENEAAERQLEIQRAGIEQQEAELMSTIEEERQHLLQEGVLPEELELAPDVLPEAKVAAQQEADLVVEDAEEVKRAEEDVKEPEVIPVGQEQKDSARPRPVAADTGVKGVEEIGAAGQTSTSSDQKASGRHGSAGVEQSDFIRDGWQKAAEGLAEALAKRILKKLKVKIPKGFKEFHEGARESFRKEQEQIGLASSVDEIVDKYSKPAGYVDKSNEFSAEMCFEYLKNLMALNAEFLELYTEAQKHPNEFNKSAAQLNRLSDLLVEISADIDAQNHDVFAKLSS